MRGHQYFVAAALLVAPTTAFGIPINGDVADQFVAGPVGSEPQDGNGSSVGNPGGFTLKIGTVNVGGVIDPNTSGRVPVYVFQLPDLGTTLNPFLTASLSFGNGAINAGTVVNVDLYGLARRDATPGVVVADYFLGDLDVTDATLLQDNILTPATVPNTIVTTDAPGSTALASFLNTQYASGVGVGQYVYLRLNVDDPMTTVTGYNAHTANDTAVAKRPVIDYTTSVVTENADFDGDDDVDGADFLVWQLNNGTASGATLEQGDANDDDAVDGDDLAVWSGQFGTAVAIAQTVPEPSAIALALFAAVACRAVARRANSRRIRL